MKGYHYTPISNLASIRKNGLRINDIHHDNLRPYFEEVKGIWIWPKHLSGRSELGMLIWQLSTKCTTKIAKLEVEFELEDCLRHGQYGLVSLSHNGTIGAFKYYTDSPRSYIITDNILPNKINLIKTFDLFDIVENKKM